MQYYLSSPEKVYNQRQDNMNKENLLHRQRRHDKKPNIKNVLSSVINEKCKVSNHEHAVFDLGYVQNYSKINCSMQGHEMRDRKNKLQEFTMDLLRKLNLHARYCEELFEIQMRKYEDYYRQIREHITQQQQFGRILINNERSKMMRIFDQYSNRIQHFKKELMKSQRYKDIDYEEKIRYFQHHTHLQVGIITVNVPEIQGFRKDFQRYVVSFREADQEKQLQQTSVLSSKVRQTPTNQPNKERNRQEPKRKELQPLSPQQDHQLDDLLGCDEQLGAKASANSIRRRKYDVGRQNVINEEDQSDDTNSMLSDS